MAKSPSTAKTAKSPTSAKTAKSPTSAKTAKSPTTAKHSKSTHWKTATTSSLNDGSDGTTGDTVLCPEGYTGPIIESEMCIEACGTSTTSSKDSGSTTTLSTATLMAASGAGVTVALLVAVRRRMVARTIDFDPASQALITVMDVV